GIAPCLAQEEVEAVRRGDLDLDDLDPLLGSGRLDDVDAQLCELVAQGLHVVGIEVELEGQSRELVFVHDAALLSKLDKEPRLRLDDELVSHPSSTPRFLVPQPHRVSTFAMQRVFPPTRSSSIVVWWLCTRQSLCEADDPNPPPRRIPLRFEPGSAMPGAR